MAEYKVLTDEQERIVAKSNATVRSTNYVASATLCRRDADNRARSVRINLPELARNHFNFIYHPRTFAAANMRVLPRATMSVYESGTIIIMGMATQATCLNSVKQTVVILTKMGTPCELYNFKLHNLVFCAFLGYTMNLEMLWQDSVKNKGFVKYNAQVFPAASIKCNKLPGFDGDVTVLIFPSSKANITGAKNEMQAYETWDKLVRMVLIHYIVVGPNSRYKGTKRKRMRTNLEVEAVAIYEEVNKFNDGDGNENEDGDGPYEEVPDEEPEAEEEEEEEEEDVDFNEEDDDEYDDDYVMATVPQALPRQLRWD